MHSGALTVTGENSTRILLSGRPREVSVRFRHEKEPHPCNPHHHDHLDWEIIHVDEDQHEHRKVIHHHHDRQFFLYIEWEVFGVREIDWFVIY
jgi:hypothetical protein